MFPITLSFTISDAAHLARVATMMDDLGGQPAAPVPTPAPVVVKQVAAPTPVATPAPAPVASAPVSLPATTATAREQAQNAIVSLVKQGKLPMAKKAITDAGADTLAKLADDKVPALLEALQLLLAEAVPA